MNRLFRVSFKASANSVPDLLKEYGYTILATGQWQKQETRYVNTKDKAVTTWTYDYANREVAVSLPDGNSKTTSYNPNGTVASQTDGRGNTSYYRYDGLNRLTDTWMPLDGNQYMYSGITYDRTNRKLSEMTGKDTVGLFRKPLGDRTLWKAYAYEANGNVKSVTDSAGGKALYQYDQDGRKTREDMYTSKEEAIITEYSYNEQNKVTSKRLHVQNRDLIGKSTDDLRESILETGYDYDANGNVLSVRMPDGQQTTYTYDAMNRLLSTEEQNLDETGSPVLVRTSKTYNWAGSVLTSTDPKGYVTTYQYDERNRLVKTIDALGNTTLTGYDLAGRQSYIVSPNNYDSARTLADMSRTEYTYDLMDRVILVTEKFNEQKVDAVNQTWSGQWVESVTKAYAYDENGNVIKELDGEGYKAGTGTSIAGRIASGYGLVRSYNAANLVVTELDAVSKERNLKFTKKYSYDGAGRKVTEIDADGVLNGTVYDDAGRVIAITVSKSYTQPEMTVKTNAYDLAGRQIAVTDGNGNTTLTSYNAMGSVRSTTSPGDASLPEYTVTNQYDLRGNLAQSSDSTGTVQLYSYDNEGRVLSHTEQAADGSDDLTTKTAYDVNGNPRFITDGNGVTTEQIFDKLDRQIQSKVTVTDASGTARLHTTTLAYDKNGNKISETDWLGNTNQYQYDAKNRLVETIDAAGVSTEKLEYNANDKQTKSYDGRWGLTQFTYDHNSRLLITTDPAGNRTSQSYNVFGFKDSQTDGNGNITRFTYDMLGRLVSVTNALGETTSYTYDLAGNKLTQTDGRGLTTAFEYNVANKLVRKIDAGGRKGAPGSYVYTEAKVESYTYTPDGQIARKTNRNGNTTNYTYDVHGQLLVRSVSGPDLDARAKENVIRYSYDGNGNTLTMTDISGTTSRTYDELNRVVTKSVPGFGTSTFLMDQTSGLTAGFVAEDTTDPKGNYSRRISDKTGRLYQVIGSKNGSAITYTYDENGNRLSVTYPSGAKEVYSYDKNNVLQTLNNYQGTTLLDTYSYVYDAAGNQISKSETIKGVNKGTTAYTYDALNRLKTVAEPGGKQTSYEYDASGNRTSEKVTSGGTVTITSYSYNEQNRLMSTTTVDSLATTVTNRYSYDNNGNMIHVSKETVKKIDPLNPVTPSFGMFIDGQPADNPKTAQIQAGTAQMTYDGWNQLISTTAGGGLSTFQYNGDGLRVKKTSTSGTTQYLYEYDQVVLEADGNGAQTARNLYGLNLLTRTVGTTSYNYLYNGHADVTALVDDAGTVQASYDYDAFGNLIANAGAVKSPIGYSGYQYDADSGLYYLNTRYYDPKIARFLSEDTYSGQDDDPLSLNLYTYTHNEPMMYYDPTGHATLKNGSSGAAVVTIQTYLKDLGFNTGKVDGAYGLKTTAAVIEFQKSVGIKADGIVGGQTLSAMQSMLTLHTNDPHEDKILSTIASSSTRVMTSAELAKLTASGTATINKTAIESIPASKKDVVVGGTNTSSSKQVTVTVPTSSPVQQTKSTLTAVSTNTKTSTNKSTLNTVKTVTINAVSGGLDSIYKAGTMNLSNKSIGEAKQMTGSTSYQIGRIIGDAVSTAAGVGEFIGSITTGIGGTALVAIPGIGTIAAGGVEAAAAAGIVHSGAVIASSTNNMASDSVTLFSRESGGKAANDLGKLRTQRVAEITGGTITEGPTVKTSRGITDIDITGPNGECIEVGGPAKAKDLGKFKTQLLKVQEVANSKGVPAQVYLEKGTPQEAIDIAKKTLGENNVFTFTLK